MDSQKKKVLQKGINDAKQSGNPSLVGLANVVDIIFNELLEIPKPSVIEPEAGVFK